MQTRQPLDPVVGQAEVILATAEKALADAAKARQELRAAYSFAQAPLPDEVRTATAKLRAARQAQAMAWARYRAALMMALRAAPNTLGGIHAR